MTSRHILLAGLAGAVLLVAAAPADAQSRRGPLRLTVEPRSFLDAGRIVPAGQYDRHLTSANQLFVGGPFTGHVANTGGFNNLPDRIGSGANPFANSFYGPSLR